MGNKTVGSCCIRNQKTSIRIEMRSRLLENNNQTDINEEIRSRLLKRNNQTGINEEIRSRLLERNNNQTGINDNQMNRVEHAFRRTSLNSLHWYQLCNMQLFVNPL